MLNPTPPLPHDNAPPAPRMPAVTFATAANLQALAAREAVREAERLAARRRQLRERELWHRHAASDLAATLRCVEAKIAELAGKAEVRA
jgi:hypothetical protein